MTPQDFCPFEVPKPKHFVSIPVFVDVESRVRNLGTLKKDLISIGELYLKCSAAMQSLGPVEGSRIFFAREDHLWQFLSKFERFKNSDRFRSLVLDHYGSDLTANVLNRVIANIARNSVGTRTMASVERLTLGEAIDLLERTVGSRVLTATSPGTGEPIQAVQPAVRTIETGEAPNKTEPEVDPSPIRKQRLDELDPAIRKAYFAWRYAESCVGRPLEDKEAHEWLHENGLPTNSKNLGELAEYELPSAATFTRYCTKARAKLEEPKYKRRGGRFFGSSIVRSDQIETQKGE